MPVPDVIYCGVRGSLNEFGDDSLVLECRFSDGQKYAAVHLDDDDIGNMLAHKIADFLNVEAIKNGYTRNTYGDLRAGEAK